jgi:hypothetical protein
VVGSTREAWGSGRHKGAGVVEKREGWSTGKYKRNLLKVKNRGVENTAKMQ